MPNRMIMSQIAVPSITSSIVRKVIGRIRRFAIPVAPWLARRVTSHKDPLVRLGTKYGGWTVAVPVEPTQSRYAILCGAGEDVSFDLALQASFDLNCVIADPTPRAIAHWQELVRNKSQNINTSINGSVDSFYDVHGVNIEKIIYEPYAVWVRDEDLKFWSPLDHKHVSFSAANIQKSDTYIVVPARTLRSICAVSPEDVEVVKLDVEGAGSSIMDWMVDNNYLPRQILVEMEECLLPTRKNFAALKRSVQKLESVGYVLVHFDGQANCTFLKIN